MSLGRKKRIHTTTTQTRIHHSKRQPEVVVWINKKQKKAYTQQQHINAYTISNNNWMRALGQKQKKKQTIRTNTIHKRIYHIKRSPEAVIGTKTKTKHKKET